MKKSIVVLALVLVCAMVLPCFAAAATFNAQADALKDMGLFLGTNNGYDLDKVPTRAQAAVMLVRFLGKEETAKTLEWTAPFTDVPDWAKPYVQYLYTAGLTIGYNDTTYAPDDTCSAQMYATFILRALGYRDENGDTFEYAKVMEFAAEKKLVTEENCDAENFLRKHLVGIAYTALTLPTADGEYETLIAKLVEDGVVTAEQAEKVISGAYLEGAEEDPEEKPEEDIKGKGLPEDTKVFKMAINSYYTASGVPADVSSIVDAWPSADERFHRGLTYMLADADEMAILEECIVASSEGQTVDGLNAGSALPMAGFDDVYIFNGKPGDADFGTTVAANLYEEYNACLASGLGVTSGPYIWLGGLWMAEADRTLKEGFYTIVLYNDDGSAVAFVEYICQNFYEINGYGY